jgi:hypothetical protein
MKAIDPPPSPSAENHPGADQLLACAKESLGSEDKERIERHLVDCAPCAEALSDLRDFFGAPREGEPEVSEIEIARAWKSIARRLPSGQASSSWASSRSTLALAASVVVAVGLGVSTMQLERRNRELEGLLSRRESRLEELETENQRLQESGSRYEAELSELKRPQPNALLIDLFSREWVQRSGGDSAVAEITVPREARSYVLILSGEGQPRAGEHALEIRGGEGKTVWRGEGLRQDPQGNFVITLDRSFLSDREYQFVLYAKRGGELNRVAEYAVRVKNQ